MASETEKVADIVKDMRDEFPPKYCSSKHCRVEVHQPVRSFADRIEAAHEREVTVLRDALKDAIELFCATCTDMDEATGKCKDKDGVCPCVKRWREALEVTKDGNK